MKVMLNVALVFTDLLKQACITFIVLATGLLWQEIELFENLNSRQYDVTDALFPEQRVDELVHVGELELAVAVLEPDLAVVVEEGLQVLVAVQRGAGQTEVVGTKSSDIPAKQ